MEVCYSVIRIGWYFYPLGSQDTLQFRSVQNPALRRCEQL